MAFLHLGADRGITRADGESLAGHNWRAVKHGANGVTAVAHAWDRPDGVLIVEPAAGVHPTVRTDDVPKIEVAAATAVGDTLIMTADGRARPAPATGGYSLGRALTSAAANGVVSVELNIEAQFVSVHGLIAGADLSAATNLFKLVKSDTEATSVVVCSAVTDQVRGVLLTPAADNAAVEIGIAGLLPVRANGVLALGATVGTSDDGEGAATTTTTHYTIGQVVVAAANAGDTAVVVGNVVRL